MHDTSDEQYKLMHDSNYRNNLFCLFILCAEYTAEHLPRLATLMLRILEIFMKSVGQAPTSANQIFLSIYSILYQSG